MKTAKKKKKNPFQEELNNISWQAAINQISLLAKLGTVKKRPVNNHPGTSKWGQHQKTKEQTFIKHLIE